MKLGSKTVTKFLAIALSATMLVGCAGGSEGGSSSSNEKPLVVGYSPFNSKFSPFFSETAYDQDVYAMTQIGLLTTDRLGQIIYNGIEGETNEYNGTEYTYYGPADIKSTENADGTVDVNIKLREDLKFSDGEPVTIDDVIFTMYALADPTYDGSSTFFALPIEGMEEYRSGMSTLYSLLVAAGKDNTDFANWDEATQTKFWEESDKAAVALAQEIVDYCVANGYNEEGDVTGAAGNWGFEVADGATVEDFAKAILEGYGNDIVAAIGTENAGSTVDDLFPMYSADGLQTGVQTDASADNIKGIKKVNDYELDIHLTKVDAPSLYQLGISITPLHYYGEKEKYDYDNNKFGFDKGDLSHIRSVTTKPLGAGPYKFVKFENGVVNFEANENYYQGAPKTKYVNFIETTDQEKLNGIVTGTIDITDPSFSKDTAQQITDENGGTDITGDKITTSLVDNLGYGYLGIDADIVRINNEKDSEASKNLRKGLATVFALYRDVAVSSYYGEGAAVINYPISNTSWAAPQSTDADYKVAFSTDVDGNDIYTSDMDDAAKEEAALKAALGFFEAAGFTVADGKVTAAPEGFNGTGKDYAIEYEAWIPADGSGDHPSFMLLTEAKKAFEKIGVNLIIKDLSNSSELWTSLEANQVPIWCAAWGATIDPDLYQVYYSDVANGGKQPGGSNYMYGIEDEELDQLIMDARASTDQAYRKTVYKACLDKIVDWATEIPVYQRQNAIIFSTERVNTDTITPDITTFYGWMMEIQNIELR